MPSLKLPAYIAWRDGKPRFVPGPAAREIGFQGENLQHPNGRWFTLQEATAWGDAKLEEIKARRMNGGPPATTPGAGSPSRPPTRCVERLLLDYMAAPATKAKLAPSTYRLRYWNLNRVLYEKQTPAERKAGKARKRTVFAQMPVERIKPIHAAAFLEDVRQNYSIAAAHQVRGLLTAAWAWGATKSLEWQLETNPIHKQELPELDGRRTVFEPKELAHLIRVADYLGVPSVGDCLVLGQYTAQRLGDRLELKDDGLKEGRRVLVQNKTGRAVSLPEPAALAERLKAARARRAALALKFGKELPSNIVLDELNGAPYNRHRYNDRYQVVRAAAVEGIKDAQSPGKWILRPMPALAGKFDKDLRATAITWAYRAGAPINSIRKISGHSYAGIATIIKHYLGEDPSERRDEVDDVMRKLEAWEARQ